MSPNGVLCGALYHSTKKPNYLLKSKRFNVFLLSILHQFLKNSFRFIIFKCLIKIAWTCIFSWIFCSFCHWKANCSKLFLPSSPQDMCFKIKLYFPRVCTIFSCKITAGLLHICFKWSHNPSTLKQSINHLSLNGALHLKSTGTHLDWVLHGAPFMVAPISNTVYNGPNSVMLNHPDMVSN